MPQTNNNSRLLSRRDSFDAEVKDLASDGKGIVQHPNGFVVFVAGVWLGERVRVQLIERKQKFGRGKLIEVLETSPYRVEPPCQYHGHTSRDCGGCQWQFVSYEAQLEAKQIRIEKAFAKLGVKYRINRIAASEKTLGYRNRAQFKTDGSILGFVANASSEIIDIEDCLVLTEKNRNSLKALRKRLPNKDWVPESKKGGSKAVWTTLDIDETVGADMASVNQRLPFKQGNDSQNQYMRDWLLQRLAKLEKNLTIFELFAGEGNFTEIVSAAGFKEIIAADIAGDAIQRLVVKELPGVEAMAQDLFKNGAVTQLLKTHKPEVLILDPPRDGLPSTDEVLKEGASIREVLYISCDLATLTRDLKQFLDGGFKVREVQPVDMFPQTPHIETLVHLRRKNR